MICYDIVNISVFISVSFQQESSQYRILSYFYDVILKSKNYAAIVY